ncbi:MAG: malectin domain-containing carbohydrate-binding protein, partial [Planctomycetaceae bacterium]
YGCDGGVDYGSFYTMRSGTAAFYDKTLESGTVFVSGPRSGCTNSIIPACGVLNVPYYYEGCTCSYPLPSALTLVSMPEYHEQWATWGKSRPEQIQRIGINFGAPGDRKTRDGTLWLEYPSAGGPSPELDVSVAPQNTTAHYRHSLFAAGGRGWPWVYSSSVAGLESFTLRKLKPGRYTVRLFFAETLQAKAGERLQDVFVGKKRVAGALDIVTGAGGPLRGLVLELDEVELDDTFTLRLSSIRGRTLLSGIELIASGLDRARVPVVKLR